MKIVVYNLGCKVNQYESDGIIHQLSELGHQVFSQLVEADAYILNTCAVTNEAERKSRQAVARCKKFNPNAVIVVCGCASQNNPTQFKDKAGVTYISGVANKANIPQLLASRGVDISPLPLEYEDNFRAKVMRTRAFVKVQDGCNNFCSYCLIPYLRGRNRSRSIASVVAECSSLVVDGVKEIVLTGINLSSYGCDISSSLSKLIIALKDLDVRLRIGSLEVNVVDRDLLMATKLLSRFCPQFHLSLQSGSDCVLKDMNRHYTTAEYLKRVELIREYYPDSIITTDLICGYPSESEQQFYETLEFLEGVGFGDVHIFGYSARNGTVASKLKVLDSDIVKHRCQMAERIVSVTKNIYLSKLIGKELEVLIEEDGSGYSLEYVRVYIDNATANTIVRAKVTSIHLEGVIAKAI